MKDKNSKLGNMVQQEDDGTYTAVTVMSGFPDEEMAEAMSEIMIKAIERFLSQKGVNPVIDDKDIN